MSCKVRKNHPARNAYLRWESLARNRFARQKRNVAVATKRRKGKGHAKHTLRAMLIELPIYAVLVVGYFFAVLHFLGDWLGHLQKGHNVLYALVAIALVITQAVVLESITTLLLRLFQGGRSE